MKKRVTRSIVPNLLTLANLLSGFTAIVHTSAGDLQTAALFILIAAIFDMLDGIMARLFKATSEFGVELDSLCDVVSFGVAPAFMLYKAYFEHVGESGILMAALPALSGVVRLARFNVQIASFDDKKYFKGMPIPASALTIISYLIFIHDSAHVSAEFSQYLVYFVTISVSGAMISNISFDNIPRPTARQIKERPFAFGIFIIGLALSIITKGFFIFPFMAFYIVASSIRYVYFWIKEKQEPEDEIDETEDSEPHPYDL
ncbi:MAG: CDP-diacylglycerol--serine O-phosphatidyltransferase [Candidatus Kapaibacterium sp.]